MNIQKNIQENIKKIKEIFVDCSDVVMRDFKIMEDVPVFMIYVDNLIDGNAMRDFIMNNFMNRYDEKATVNLDFMETDVLAVAETLRLNDFDAVTQAVLAGEIVIFMDNEKFALQTSLKMFPNRGVNQPQTEVVIQGPKDAFLEVLALNIALIRRRVRDENLKLVRKRIGKFTKTDVAVLYMENLARPESLQKILQMLDDFQKNGVLDSGSLEQLLEKNWLSPFPQFQLTERPDKTSAALMEGRVVVAVDNSPFVILLPSTLNTFFQSAEDYYERFEIMSFTRVIRYFASFGALTLSAFFIAFTTFHPELLPTAFALKVATTRQSIPFSAPAEVFMMEVAFELLREAGVRLPSPISSTIGIVGGIIIGSAAVEAGIVSPLVVIVSAVSVVCTFVIPNVAFVSALRLCKFFVMAFATLFGLFGVWSALIILLIHLTQLNSFGIPYLYPFCSGNFNGEHDWKDSIVRFPLRKLHGKSVFPKQNGGEN